MNKMKVGYCTVGPLQTNCYLAMNTETGEVIIIDPGASAAAIMRVILEMGGKPAAILLTHGHFDHVMAVDDLKKHYEDIPVIACLEEKKCFEDPNMNLSADFMNRSCNIQPDRFLKPEEHCTLASFDMVCLHTPGHTPGSCCYYFPAEDVVFSGDTLFRESAGRTDFKGGSSSDMRRSLRRLIDELPPCTDVFPGHDRETTIQHEKEYNPFV